MTEREYNVVVKSGADLQEVEQDLKGPSGSTTIPSRSVDVVNPRPGSTRITSFALTEQEVAQLQTDNRILAVEIPPEQRTDIEIGLHGRQAGNFDKTSLDDGNFQNWGLKRCISETLNYGSTGGPTDNDNYDYSYDGTGVDVVIQDSGIEPNHPEWNDYNGTTRLQQIDWYTASGISGTQSSNHYRDYDGHGTHCAGIAAGLTFGWAKGSRIYAQKLSGLEGSGDTGTGISISDAFDTIRLWHNNKSGADANRPTVVNMSWGYGYNLAPSAITTGNYRGTAWNFATDYSSNSTTLWTNTGIVFPYYTSGGSSVTRFPVRVASVDAEVEDMISAGIHVCIAAGNTLFKIDSVGGADYDNTITRSGSPEFYHRGSSPYSENAFMVGNIDSGLFSSLDHRAFSSCNGPGTNIWAPGSNIMSATSAINDYGASGNYYLDSNFEQTNIGGTSMASPQVAGVAACYLQKDNTLTPAQLFTQIVDDSKAVIYNTGNDDDYTNTNGVCGSPNRMLFNKYGYPPFSMNLAFNMTNGATITSS